MFPQQFAGSLIGTSQPRRFAMAFAGVGGGLPGLQQPQGSPFSNGLGGFGQAQQGQQGNQQNLLMLLLGMIMGLLMGLSSHEGQQQGQQQACPRQGNFGQPQGGALAGIGQNGQPFAAANPGQNGLSFALALSGGGLGGQNFLG
jgi:hypothetical protein